ncbi:hypothetical protein V8C86DRAFT_3091347 [Haematococcus lacustris]
MGSRDGSGFTTLFELTVEQPKHVPQGMAADSEGCIWVAKENTISRFTAMGASTGKSYSVPTPQTGQYETSAPIVYTSALQCLDDSTEGGKVLFMTSSKSLCQLDLGSKEVKEGELQLLRSDLIVAHDMLAVNKAGDVLFFQPHPDNKKLLSLMCLRVSRAGLHQPQLTQPRAQHPLSQGC